MTPIKLLKLSPIKPLKMAISTTPKMALIETYKGVHTPRAVEQAGRLAGSLAVSPTH